MSTKDLNRRTPVLDRYWSRVNKTETCWLWTGAASGGGRYAEFMVNGKTVKVHRWAYETFVGLPIPEGLQIDHMCGTTLCVRPDHLRPLTASENVMAHWREQRGTCRNGHDITDEANAVFRLGGTVRLCRTCERDRKSRYRRARKVA